MSFFLGVMVGILVGAIIDTLLWGNKGVVSMGVALKTNKIYRKLYLDYIKANLGVEIKE